MAAKNASRRRLDQLLSQCGYCSRREAAAWVRAGRVTVGGSPVRDASTRVVADEVRIDGEPLDHPDGLFILLNKPAGYVCSHDLSEGPRVYDLLPARWLERNPVPTTVGRLDRDTTGALLITDLMPLVHQLTSPRRTIDKVYQVTVDAPLRDDLASIFAAGRLMLPGEDKPVAPAKLEVLGERSCELTLHEGRYHQVKRMFAACGYQVISLHRSRFGPYTLEGLEPGAWREVPMPGAAGPGEAVERLEGVTAGSEGLEDDR